MITIHPDLTAFRAVDACGGHYTLQQEADGYATGHRAALNAACVAVDKCDALMEEMLEALKELVEWSEGFFPEPKQPLGGIWATARTVITKAERAQ